MSSDMCDEVSALCPVEATLYGYYPQLGTNATLCAVFAILAIAQIVLGISKRVYAYSFSIAAGCVLEAAGYGGRLMMNRNPWDSDGQKLQIVALVLAPTLIAAGIYLTLKSIVVHNGPEHSRLKPALYTWIFIGCDVGSLCLQAIGGGVAAAAEDDQDLLEAGNNVIISGIAFQVATMVVCGVLASEYAFKRHRSKAQQSKERMVALDPATKREKLFERLFVSAVTFAYLTVLIRCIYRLPEMAGGWGNPRMRNEKEFLILDGLMIALASASLTIFHPGIFYPSVRTVRGGKSSNIQSSSTEGSATGLPATA